jgi:predicted DNA-binding transcriptional regulator YafY
MLKFERLLLILNLIRSRPGIKSAELARETGMSQRTIYRDILNVASQYPVLYDNGYRLLPTAYLKTMNLTQSEYSLLQTALSCPALQRPDLKSRARTLKGKIDTVVDPAVRKSVSLVNHNCMGTFSEKPIKAQFQKAFTTLEKTIEQKRVV